MYLILRPYKYLHAGFIGLYEILTPSSVHPNINSEFPLFTILAKLN
jgi:hypothetical protein